jgi:hypothetical protein
MAVPRRTVNHFGIRAGVRKETVPASPLDYGSGYAERYLRIRIASLIIVSVCCSTEAEI